MRRAIDAVAGRSKAIESDLDGIKQHRSAAGLLAVGNGAGFWGDNLDAPFLLARDGRIDVLTLEYLAELTMAILSHLRSQGQDRPAM